MHGISKVDAKRADILTCLALFSETISLHKLVKYYSIVCEMA